MTDPTTKTLNIMCAWVLCNFTNNKLYLKNRLSEDSFVYYCFLRSVMTFLKPGLHRVCPEEGENSPNFQIALLIWKCALRPLLHMEVRATQSHTCSWVRWLVMIKFCLSLLTWINSKTYGTRWWILIQEYQPLSLIAGWCRVIQCYSWDSFKR